MYYDYRRRSSISPLLLLAPVILFLGLGSCQMLRSLPAIEATPQVPSVMVLGDARQLPLPATGGAIVSVNGLGYLAANGADSRRPIASLTKMMTAYVILKAHPLRSGESGPTITLTAQHASRYFQMINEDQSALPVTAGLQLTQLELLQGLLVASANNYAEILAAWDATTLQAFVTKMNDEARALGMANTTYSDPSGFLASTTSTAQDQHILARNVMHDPVLAQIVSMPQVRLPGVGLVSAVNQLLGQEGVVGIKTGFTEEAGGNLAFAANRQVNGQPVEVIGVVLGQTTRPLAFEATRRLLVSIGQGLQSARVIGAGQPVATIKAEWGDEVTAVAGEDVQMLLWPGMTLEATVEFEPVRAPLERGSQVGWLNLKLGEQQRRVPVNLADDLPQAGVLWRLARM